MSDQDAVETRSERWLVDAGRQLDPPQSDIERLTSSVIESARRLSHPRAVLTTDLERIVVTDRVVRRLLLVEVRRALSRPVLKVELVSREGEVTSIRLGVVCWYDDLLDDLAASTRTAIARVLAGALGAERGARAADLVDIDWVDLDEDEYKASKRVPGSE